MGLLIKPYNQRVIVPFICVTDAFWTLLKKNLGLFLYFSYSESLLHKLTNLALMHETFNFNFVQNEVNVD